MKNYTFVDYATQAYLALVGLLILFFHNSTVPAWPRLLGAHAAGLVLVHALIQAQARRQPARALDFLRHFYPVLLYLAFFCETGSINRMFYPDYLDPQVARWEQALFGCQPSVLFMEKLPWLAVSELFYAAYFSYYIMIAWVGIALFLRSRQQFFHYVSVLSFLFYVCYLIFIFLPIIGPRAFFHQVEGYSLPPATQQLAVTDAYPAAVQAGLFFRLMRWLYRVFEAPGAALPSSHVAVAWCTVFFSFRYLRRIRFFHLAVVLLLCLATVYCRYHYVVDVLAGLVAAAVLIPAGNWLYFKFGQRRPDRPADQPKPSGDGPPPALKPKLLVVELWGLGDLVIATPFLQAASQKYAVTLLAKPYAEDLQKRFWPGVSVVPFVAPWTAFKQINKYRLWAWPWRTMFRLRNELAAQRFDVGLSARWDPRNHLLLWLARAKTRLGFPRVGSGISLTRRLARPEPQAHSYESWRVMAAALGFEVPAREALVLPQLRPGGEVLVHTGAGQPVRVWPLERYHKLVARLRQQHYRVQVACDPDQRDWWIAAGEKNLAVPRTVTELFALVDRAGAFIGNDSGPGHLAAFCGVPTFTLFGPQLPEWFAPLHPGSEWLEGKACPYKPCSDYCRFPTPCCMVNSSEEEVWALVEAFVARTLHAG